MTPINLGRLGVPGIIGCGLLLFCLSFYIGSMSPAQSTLESLQKEEAVLSRQLMANRHDRRSHSAPVLLPAATIPDVLDRLNAAAAKSGFPLAHLSYRLTEDGGARRYEITLALKGTYPKIRRLLRKALSLSSPATLDDIELHRKAAAAPEIDAQARLSYFFAP